MDARERAALVPKWWKSLDENRMMALVALHVGDDEEEALEIPFKYELCDLCLGKGEHVNPSVDSNGLSQEDFDEDPDFEENYHAGMYDIICLQCNGKRVVPIPDADAVPPELKEKFDLFEQQIFDAIEAAELELHEARMGY